MITNKNELKVYKIQIYVLFDSMHVMILHLISDKQRLFISENSLISSKISFKGHTSHMNLALGKNYKFITKATSDARIQAAVGLCFDFSILLQISGLHLQMIASTKIIFNTSVESFINSFYI